MPLFVLGIARSRDVVRVSDPAVRWVLAEGLAAVVVGPQDAPPAPSVHCRTLAAIHLEIDVLPAQMGAGLPDEDAVRDLLRTRAASLAGSLDRLEGMCEMGLRIRWAPRAPHPGDGPTAPLLSDDYLSQLRARYAREDAESHQADAVAASYVGAIGDLCQQWHRLSPEPTGVVRLAFLVDRHHCDEVRHRLKAAIAARPTEHCTLLGPWPPYSFV